MRLTIQEIDHLAALAHLALRAEEKDLYRDQLSSVLDYVAKLNEVDTSKVEPTAQVTGLANQWREDVVRGCTADVRERLLENMPEREGDSLKVKGVIAPSGTEF